MRKNSVTAGILLILLLLGSLIVMSCSPKKTEVPSTELTSQATEDRTEESEEEDRPEGLSVEDEYTVELDDHQEIDGF